MNENPKHNSTQSSIQKECRDINIQTTPHEISGMISASNIKLPSIFSPDRKRNYVNDEYEELSLIDMTSDLESSQNS